MKKLPSIYPLFCANSLIAVAIILLPGSYLLGQRQLGKGTANIVVPQQKSYISDSSSLAPIIIGIDVAVTITNQTAVTELTVTLRHPFSSESNIAPESREKLTADIPFSLAIPLPDKATVQDTRVGGEITGKHSLAEFSAADGVSAYQAMARQAANAAPLEFIGNKLLRCGDFSLSLGEQGTFTVIYQEPLSVHGDQIDYLLPRSESFAFRQVPWNITVKISSLKSIAAIYSPSHPLIVDQQSSTQATVKVQALSLEGAQPRRIIQSNTISAFAEEFNGQKLDPGAFRLSYITGSELTASFTSHSDLQGEAGCFQMLVGAPPLEQSANDVVKREIILVIDRSGSMRGEKIEQVRKAALKILDDLREGEAFNIVDYADVANQFVPMPVIKNAKTLKEAKEYLQRIKDDGGTNIHDALVNALSQEPTPDYLPLIIFLTDGVPTVGVKGEVEIREAVKKANIHRRRIFSFGVGSDVNAPLLDGIATESRGTTTFALPGEDIEKKITDLFRRFNGPIFSDIELQVTTPDGRDASHLVENILPEKIKDLFEGERIILLGSFLTSEPLVFTLRGNYLGAERSFPFTFDPTKDFNPEASYVCRLLATRQITNNVNRISQAGAIPKEKRTDADEADLKKRIEEIVKLSTANGIITEYTDYLADTKTELNDEEKLLTMAESKLRTRAQEDRIGSGAANQAINNSGTVISGGYANRRNTFLDKDLQVVELTSVQQIHDLTFFRRNQIQSASPDTESTDISDTTSEELVSTDHPAQQRHSSNPDTIKLRLEIPLLNRGAQRLPVGSTIRFKERWVDARILDSAGTQNPDRTIIFGTDEYDRFVEELMNEGRQGILSLDKDILLLHDGKLVLIVNSPELK